MRGLVLFLLVGSGYALGSQVAFSWFGADGVNASFFPAAGVTLAALTLVPRHQWPIVLLAAGIAEFSLDLGHGIGLLPSAGYVAANLAQPLVGALLLGAVVRRVDIGQTYDLVAFLGCAVVAAPAVGGALGATNFVFLDAGDGWARFAGEWWIGDGLGVLVVGGAILSLRAASARPLTIGRAGSSVLLGVVALAATAAVFWRDLFALAYAPIVILIVLAFRAGTRGVAFTAAGIALIAAEATAEGWRYWETLDIAPETGLVYLQLALGVMTATMLALASQIQQRERAAVQLARAESERTAALERSRLADREREARIRAESLGRSAALLARTGSVADVAEAAVSALSEWGPDDAAFYVLDEEQLVCEAAVGSEEQLRKCGTDSAEAAAPIVIDSGVDTLAAFPIVFDGAVAAVLAVRIGQPGWMTRDRRDLLAALGDQAAVALERARLRARADAAAEDAALLAHLGVVLERAIGMADRASALVRALTAERACIAAVHALDETGTPRLIARQISSSGCELGDAVLDSVAAAALAKNSVEALDLPELKVLAVPLRARNRALGILTMGVRRPGMGRLNTVLMQRVGTRAALALDNALLYEQERDVSHSLQLGLLGGQPAATPDTVIATAYRPGTTALEVGGDWYDAFTLPDGRLALLVGDVVGHGLEAAVAMGQLRGAVRALAPTGPPREVLEGLDAFVEQLGAAAMATLAYAELDPVSGRIAYACAGHPPPLVVPAEGEPRLVWDGRSTPLGASFGAGRVEATDLLQPGDTIVLYTDGLVEDRERGIASGLEELLEIAAGASGAEPSQFIDAILDALLTGRTQEDDVCVLAVRLLARDLRFAHSFPAAPAELSQMRSALATWLERVDVDATLRKNVVLAASEAAGNAIEHAYGFDGEGIVTVEAWVANGELELAIHDHGSWREQSPDGDRGRGLRMMEALMRSVTIEPGEGGTVVRMSVSSREEVPA